MALINKLSAIGDAIREKTGKEDLLTLDQMPAEIKGISGGGGGEIEPTVLSGNCQYACSGPLSSKYISLFGNTISTEKITNGPYMFYYYTGSNIPFDINFSNETSGVSLTAFFAEAENLTSLPKLSETLSVGDLKDMFIRCRSLREIPEDYFDNLDYRYLMNSNSLYIGNWSSMFSSCYSLRKIPMNFLKKANPKASYTYSFYRDFAYYCYALDEMVNIPMPYISATWTNNAFSGFASNAYRAQNITFETNAGEPIAVNWKSQIIDLSKNVGWGSKIESFINYNSGITADKEVKDDTTYQALKNDPDWFSIKVAYSRYNHDSAVATINSLPDASAYLATAGGTNTIKFKGNAGSLTDGGAINTLTEEEIAVATNKGWTITFG